ncbi:MAG: hypothetical protein ACREDD_09430 [Methylocella sp.]
MSTGGEYDKRNAVWLPSLDRAAAGDTGQQLAIQASNPAPQFGAGLAPFEGMPRASTAPGARPRCHARQLSGLYQLSHASIEYGY